LCASFVIVSFLVPLEVQSLLSEFLQIAIAGATSLRGKDLKESIEESAFPAGEIRLLDEELAAGTVTEVAGEPAIVQPIDESSFERQRFVFFTGSQAFAAKHGRAAERAGATVIDLTGGLADTAGARLWIPQVDALLGPSAASKNVRGPVSLYLVPSTSAIVACSLSAALRDLGLTRLAIVFFQPASTRGAAGVEELEEQTVKLLSLQAIPKAVFDAQVAFNLLDRWGAESPERLAASRSALDREVRGCLDGRAPFPAMKLVQAPVFFGEAFSVYAEFSKPLDFVAADARLQEAGFLTVDAEDPEPSNVSVAGGAQPVIRRAELDPGVEGAYWFWGAADNLRVASANAIRVAERLLAS
jgi:aspartate-semialdehyde dehydrogenase